MWVWFVRISGTPIPNTYFHFLTIFLMNLFCWTNIDYPFIQGFHILSKNLNNTSLTIWINLSLLHILYINSVSLCVHVIGHSACIFYGRIGPASKYINLFIFCDTMFWLVNLWGRFCNSFVCPSVCSFVRPFVCSSIHLFVRSFICPSIRLFVRSSVRPDVFAFFLFYFIFYGRSGPASKYINLFIFCDRTFWPVNLRGRFCNPSVCPSVYPYVCSSVWTFFFFFYLFFLDLFFRIFLPFS
jgi:hypothetical protein